jgi:hypothetical protein
MSVSRCGCSDGCGEMPQSTPLLPQSVPLLPPAPIVLRLGACRCGELASCRGSCRRTERVPVSLQRRHGRRGCCDEVDDGTPHVCHVCHVCNVCDKVDDGTPHVCNVCNVCNVCDKVDDGMPHVCNVCNEVDDGIPYCGNTV